MAPRAIRRRRGGGRPSSVVSSRTSWVVGGSRWAEYPSDPALVAEAERARDRDDWCNDQREQALGWLQDHGFDADADAIDRDALEVAIARLSRNVSGLRTTGDARPP